MSYEVTTFHNKVKKLKAIPLTRPLTLGDGLYSLLDYCMVMARLKPNLVSDQQLKNKGKSRIVSLGLPKPLI